ncbi:MAG: Gldg family protein [Lachnospirales bacterium]
MKKILSDKRLKWGTFSTIITIIVIAILIFVNLVVGQFNKSFDLTGKSTYSLSDETKEVLKSLDSEIYIYTMFETSNSDAVITKVQQVLNKYKEVNSNIKLENIDLYLHPDFANKYSNENTKVSVNSIIVEKGDRHRVIGYDDYYIQNSSSYNTEEINIEANITSAIEYVTNKKSSKLYFVTGHGETDFNHFTTLTNQLKLANYEMENINLLEKDIPSDCTVLIVTFGSRDFTVAEADKVKKYLSNDGRGFFLLGGTDTSQFKNISSIINAYGVTLEKGYVFEGNSDNYYKYPYAIFPEIKDCEINKTILSKGYTLYSVASQAVTELDVKKQGLKIEPLITSTNKAYIKAEGNTSPNKEAGDLEGEFSLACAITDSSYTDKSHTTKLIVSGTSYYFIDPSYDEMVANANSTFVVSAINWLNDLESDFTITPKSLSTDTVLIDEGSANMVKIVGWGIIPVTLFLIGFIIWLIRRNK